MKIEKIMEKYEIFIKLITYEKIDLEKMILENVNKKNSII